jgi:hypothetical protein
MLTEMAYCVAAASKGETGIQDAASADAADMIARAKAKATQLEGPGISVLHEVRTQVIGAPSGSL